jgi:hypothetical protein
MPDRSHLVVIDRLVMGIHTRLDADDAALSAALLAGVDAWPEAAPEADTPALRLHFTRAQARVERKPGVTVEGDSLRLAAEGAVGGADARRGEGWCSIPPGLIADPERLATEVLDTLLLFLLTRAGRTPLHAAGVLVGETAAILAGPSGSGKSTLAHAALRASLPVLSDDTVYLQRDPEFRVWGYPRPIHLLPVTADMADARGAPRLRGGRWKVAVPSSPSAAPPHLASRAAVFLLTRGDAVALRAISADEALAELTRALEPGFDHFRNHLPAAARAAAAGGAWRHTLSVDAGEAIAEFVAVLRAAT